MTPERWRRVKAIFQEAAERDAAARAAYLGEACGADDELRGAVDRLLAAHDRAEGFLDTPAGVERGLLADPPPVADEAPSHVGPYRVIRELGRGGMGTVYLAERDESDLKRVVAIKIVNVASGSFVRRFRTEIGVLSALTHPGIARLYDAGATAAGVPYLVMEFIDGEDLLTYCDRTRAPIADRLRLFLRVCAAVQYAHQNFVVHRDLKPSNILVTRGGEPKLLDFGVAKLLSAGGDDDTAMLPRALTPQYSSPEHVRGETVTTASDVYSLGVILYELLTGTRPYRVAGRTAAEIERAVTEQEPARPSTAATMAASADARDTTVHRLRTSLQGDLDNIALKALQKDPQQRYATAADLAEDIQRHLDGYPVHARANTLGYRAARFLRRHRRSAAAATLAAVSLVGGLGLAIWQAHVARLERDRATERVHDVQRLANSLIFKIHDGVQNLPNSTPVRRMIIAEALGYLETLRNDPAADESLRIELSQAYQRIGIVQGQGNVANLGDARGAIDSLTKGLDVLRPLLADPVAHRAAAVQFGRTALSLATTLLTAGDKTRADAAMREAAEVAGRLVSASPGDDDSRRLLATVEFQYALHASGQESLAHWKTAGDLFESLLNARPDDPDRQRNVALVHKYLGSIYTDGSDFDAAFVHHSRARDLDEKRLAANPSDRLAQIDVAVDLANTGRVLTHTGRHVEAIAEYERSLAIRQRLADSDSHDTFALGRVAFVHARLAYLYRVTGEKAKGLDHARLAVSLNESFGQADPVHRGDLAEALLLLGDTETAVGDEAAACRHYRASRAIFEELDTHQTFTDQQVNEHRRYERILAGYIAACRH